MGTVKTRQLFNILRGYVKRKRSRNISKTAFLARNVQLLGVSNILIGRNCVIGERTTITINDRRDDDIRLTIGDNSYLGRDCFISVGRRMRIGEYCILGNNCALVCSDHLFDDPFKPYASTGASFEESIEVGCNCWFGINVTVVGNVRIGHGCILGANTVVSKDIPPFSIAVGNPARIFKRYDFEQKAWVKGETIEEVKYLEESEYLEYLRQNSGDLPIAYHSGSSQFGDV